MELIGLALLIGSLATGSTPAESKELPQPPEDQRMTSAPLGEIDIRPGTRVRVRVRGGRRAVVGVLKTVDANGLTLSRDDADGAPLTLQHESIEGLETPHRHPMLGIAVGTTISVAAGTSARGALGAMGGVIIGLPASAVGAAVTRGGGGVAGGMLASTATGALIAVALFGGEGWAPVAAAVGAGYGLTAGLGATLTGHEHWEPVVARRRALAIGASRRREDVAPGSPWLSPSDLRFATPVPRRSNSTFRPPLSARACAVGCAGSCGGGALLRATIAEGCGIRSRLEAC